MASSSPDQPGSSLTSNEIAAAMAVARRLGVRTGDDKPIGEMELARILESVYDQRLDGATHAIKRQVSSLELKRDGLGLKVQALEEEKRELEQSRRIRRAWNVLLPHIRNTDWYKAAMAVRDLDEEFYD